MPRKPAGSRRKVSPLGLNLRRRREALALRKEDLAERSGVSRQTIIDLETGARTGARMGTVEALAAALHVPTAELVETKPISVDTAQLVEEFLRSPWGEVTKPTRAEIDWLRSVPALVLFDLRPTPETLHHMIQAFRSRRKD